MEDFESFARNLYARNVIPHLFAVVLTHVDEFVELSNRISLKICFDDFVDGSVDPRDFLVTKFQQVFDNAKNLTTKSDHLKLHVRFFFYCFFVCLFVCCL